MRTISIVLFSSCLLFSYACKSEACECADVYVKAVKEMNQTNDMSKRLEIMDVKYKKEFTKCNEITSKLTPEELKQFEEEYEQCPSVKAFVKESTK